MQQSLRRRQFHGLPMLLRLQFALLMQKYLEPHSTTQPAFGQLGWRHRQLPVYPAVKFADFLYPQQLSAISQWPKAPTSHQSQHEPHGRHPSPKQYATSLRIFSRQEKQQQSRLLFRLLSNGQLLLPRFHQTGSSTF